jgi:hypothetical protein
MWHSVAHLDEVVVLPLPGAEAVGAWQNIQHSTEEANEKTRSAYVSSVFTRPEGVIGGEGLEYANAHTNKQLHIYPHKTTNVRAGDSPKEIISLLNSYERT